MRNYKTPVTCAQAQMPRYTLFVYITKIITKICVTGLEIKRKLMMFFFIK